MLRRIMCFALVFSLVGMGSLKADIIVGTSDYDQVRINDNTKEKTLYQVFNQHFETRTINRERFTSSNDLYDALKMTPTSGQIAVGVPGNKVSLAAGEYDLMLKATAGSTSYEFSFDPSQNRDGLIHMIMLDLSWYYDEPAFLVAIEDMYNGSIYGDPDWDFNDGIYVFRLVEASVESGGGTATPEPATALILGLGLADLPLARRFRKKKANR